MNQNETERNRSLAKPLVEALRVISGGNWKWVPEVGEWCVHYSSGASPSLIIEATQEEIWLHNFGHGQHPQMMEVFIPIFHWERIEEILHELGCKTGGPVWDSRRDKYEYRVFKNKRYWKGIGETCYESVVGAVIKLGEEDNLA